MKANFTRYLPMVCAAGLLTVSGAQAETTEAVADYNSAADISMYRPESSEYQLRASDVVGREVVNSNNDGIGEVDDIVVDRDGRVHLVLALGGILGLGEKMVTVPMDSTRLGPDNDYVYVDINEDSVDSMAEFSYLEDEPTGRERWTMYGEGRNLVDWDAIETNWDEFKAAAQEKWNELTDEDWQAIDSDHSEIRNRIEAKYQDLDRDQIERDLFDLSNSL